MTMSELIKALTDLAAEAAVEGIRPDELTVSSYLLGDGKHLKLYQPYVDGSTLHLDFEREEA